MKKTLVMCVIAMIGMMSTMAYADVGIGLKWGTRNATISDGKITCVDYGLYNPFSRNVTAYLTGTKELEQFFIPGENINVSAGTDSKDAIPVKACFKPEIYNKTCMIGDLFCTNTCPSEPRVFNGTVTARYISISTGMSATSAGFSAPLLVTVKCEPIDTRWQLYAIIVGSALAITLIAALSLQRKNKKVKQ